jgi:regulator of sigma E protease
MSIIYFIVGLGLLIFIHELGHFLVAKWSGIRVERFSLGFGPRILKIQKGETEYCISALPLGGYVKMSGQEDFEEGEILPLDDPRAFSSKSLLTRLAVVLAGPGMNLLLPFLLMPIVFLLGRSEPKYLSQAPIVIGVQAQSPAQAAGLQPGDRILAVDGHAVQNWNEALRGMTKPPDTTVTVSLFREGKEFSKTLTAQKEEGIPQGFLGIEPMFFVDVDPVIGEVAKDSPAQAGGVKAGDRVLAIGEAPIQDWIQMSDAVNASHGGELKFTLQRGAATVEARITPQFDKKLKKYTVGVLKASNPEAYEERRYSLSEAFQKGFQENVVLLGMTFKVLKDLVTLKASYKELGGPVRIAQISAKAAEKGLGNFLYLLAFLSIQLGILNLLPIPVLDGGHVAFMAYEAVARKPLSSKKRLIAQQVGMFLLLTLMVLVTVNDIESVWGFQRLLERFKGWFG